jgi:hypothetical protein
MLIRLAIFNDRQAQPLMGTTDTTHSPSGLTTVTTMSDFQDNRGPEIVLFLIILLAVTWISVILRIYVRFWIIKAFGADDWLIIAALVRQHSELR